MADHNPGFEKMLGMWKEGQEAFFDAQKEAAESFTKSFASSLHEKGQDSMPDWTAAMGGDDVVSAWTKLVSSWAPSWDISNLFSEPANAGIFGLGGERFFDLLDTSNWLHHAPEQLREILQSISQGPRFADLATPHSDAATAWREVLDYQKAAADFAKVLQLAWKRAFETFSKEFSLEDLQSGQSSEALNSWLAIANAELLETQASSEFMDAQRRLLRSGLEIKARQREIAETWSEAYQMPTRTEIDDMAKTIHELRREVRMIKRELASIKASKS